MATFVFPGCADDMKSGRHGGASDCSPLLATPKELLTIGAVPESPFSCERHRVVVADPQVMTM